MIKLTTFVINTHYIISNLFNDKRRYYSIDSSSGGYSYWSDYISSAKEFKDLNDIPTNIDVDEGIIQVLQVEALATIIPTKDIIYSVEQKAMQEISRLKEELSKKVAALNNLNG